MCKKCGGTVQHMSDFNGPYLSCMMCGLMIDLDTEGRLRTPAEPLEDRQLRKEHVRRGNESRPGGVRNYEGKVDRNRTWAGRA